jgi:hypothetical protein
MLRTYILPGLGVVRLDRLGRENLLGFTKRLDDLHRTDVEQCG